MTLLQYCVSALLLLQTAEGFVVKPSCAATRPLLPLSSTEQQSDEFQISTHRRYKMDIDELSQLLDDHEEEKLDQIKCLVKHIKDIRQNNPEVALPRKVRSALADFHHAEEKYGPDSREAKIAHEYFHDVSTAHDLRPDRHLEDDPESMHVLERAIEAVNVLEELKEIARVEKSMLDRFGSTDFEVGEGFLERGIGREDYDTCDLWP